MYSDEGRYYQTHGVIPQVLANGWGIVDDFDTVFGEMIRGTNTRTIFGWSDSELRELSNKSVREQQVWALNCTGREDLMMHGEFNVQVNGGDPTHHFLSCSNNAKLGLHPNAPIDCPSHFILSALCDNLYRLQCRPYLKASL